MEIAIKYNLAQLQTSVTDNVSLKEFLKVTAKARELKQELRLCTQFISSELEKTKHAQTGFIDPSIKYQAMLEMESSNVIIIPKENIKYAKNMEALLRLEGIDFVQTTFMDADLECFKY